MFGGAAGFTVLDPPVLGGALGALSGAIDAASLVTVIYCIELFLPQTRLGFALERAPFLVTLATKSLVYVGVIALVIAGKLGRRVIVVLGIAGDMGPALARQSEHALPAAMLIAVVFMVVPLLIVIRQLARLVGERTVRDIVRGRYHHPRTEERFFLFVDIAGSTPLAERIGPVAVHRFLGRVFQVASSSIDDNGGEVYQYVGDEIVITWTAAEGRLRARPLACFFAIERQIEQVAPEFERDFGAIPRLRAALHAGPVVAGEIGGSWRAIVFHGDVMNTTSRLEHATRDLERKFLVSQDALDRLEGLDPYKFEDLGALQLRGRAAPARVYAVEIA